MNKIDILLKWIIAILIGALFCFCVDELKLSEELSMGLYFFIGWNVGNYIKPKDVSEFFKRRKDKAIKKLKNKK